jgi:hypothetical protein
MKLEDRWIDFNFVKMYQWLVYTFKRYGKIWKMLNEFIDKQSNTDGLILI